MAQFRKCKDRRGVPVRGLWERNGRYYAQINIKGKQTKIPLHCQSVAQASDKLLQMRREVKTGRYEVAVDVPTLGKYVMHYMENTHKSPKTMQGEEYFLEDWKTYLGEDTRLDEITPSKIIHFRSAQVAKKLSNRTVNLRVGALRNLFKLAKTEGLVKTLPMEGIKQLRYVAPQKRLLTPEDIDKVIAAAIDCCPRSGTAFGDFIRLLACTGMRETECLCLKWEHVDFDKRWVAIPPEFTKNKRPRYINFNPRLEEHLKSMQERKRSDWLFPSPRSKSHVTNFKSTLEKSRGKAGVYLSEHLLRHYFISHCVMQGFDLMTIARWVGHTDTVLIGRTYGHLAAQHMVDAGNKLKVP